MQLASDAAKQLSLVGWSERQAHDVAYSKILCLIAYRLIGLHGGRQFRVRDQQPTAASQ